MRLSTSARLVALVALCTVLASCDSGSTETTYTIPIVRLVGATIQTAPGLTIDARPQVEQIGEREATCSIFNGCIGTEVVNPTLAVPTATLNRDAQIDSEPVAAGTDIVPLLEYPERIAFGSLSPEASRSMSLAARLDVPDDTQITLTWTTVDDETISASATLQP